MENCLDEVPHSSQDYYPHYNLFQSSIFYDTDNFRVAYLSLRYDDCLSTETKQRSAEPPDKPPEEPVDPVVKDKRVISKKDLYKDPDLFQSKMEDGQPKTPNDHTEPPYLNVPQRWGYDWTKQSWVKSAAQVVVMSKKQLRKEKRRLQQNPCRQLENAPRISISKAESMMQKMGWQGGALGKAGDGILDPITPDPLYGSSNLGFGQRTKNPPIAPPKKGSKKDNLWTNVLLHILDFVRDDTEIELHFDAALRPHERRAIHTLVNNVVAENNLMDLASAAQYDLVGDIDRCNRYGLASASEGEPPHRQIIIYKEAPENVYLVTPDDFLPKDEEADDDEQTDNEPPTIQDKENDSTAKNDLSNTDFAKAKETQDTRAMDLEDDENPFLKSIKKSIKRDDEPITNKFEKDCNIAKDETVEIADDNATPREKMVEFFLEFADSEVYNEFRFLGKFTLEQTNGINDFLNDLAACIDDVNSFKGNEEITKVFKSGKARYELKEGCNGTTEIHKITQGSSDT